MVSAICNAATLEGGFLAWSRLASSGWVVETANLDGSGVEVIAANASSPLGVAADKSGNIYYTEINRGGVSGQPGEVIRTNLAGTRSSIIYTASGSNTLGSIDLVGSNIYWAESLGVFSTSELHTADMDGLGGRVIPVDIPQTSPPYKPFGDIGIDEAFGKIFWSYSGTNSNIVSSNIDGSNSQEILSGIYNRGAFGLDKNNRFIYFSGGSSSSPSASSLFRSNYDGTDVQQILGLGVNISGIEVDNAAGWIYWREGNDAIRRADLNDVSSIETIYSGGGIRGFTVVSAVPVPPAIILFISGIVVLCRFATVKI